MIPWQKSPAKQPELSHARFPGNHHHHIPLRDKGIQKSYRCHQLNQLPGVHNKLLQKINSRIKKKKKKNFQFIFQVLESFKYVWSPKDTTVTKYQVNSTGSPPEIIKLFELEGTLEGHLAQSPCKEQGEPHPASQCPQGLGIHYLSDQLTTLILKSYSFISNLNLTS